MTALTTPPDVDDDESINIDSVVCTCCDTRWWPDTGPIFPESFLCEICEQWFALFQIYGQLPVIGPARTLRRALAGQQITQQEWFTDESPFVMVTPAPAIRDMVNQILEERVNANR